MNLLFDSSHFGDIFDNEDNLLNEINNEGSTILNLVKNKQIPYTITSNFLNSPMSLIFRKPIIKYLGFPLLTQEFINNLSQYIGDKKCLEIMAGNGALSKCLQDNNIDIIATDNYSWSNQFNLNDTWTHVENIDCLDSIRKYGKDIDFILCSWIPYDNPIGYYALKTMYEVNPSCKMIVFGEAKYGCTADDSFFEYSKSIYGSVIGYDNDISGYSSWYSIHDTVNVIEFKSS